MLVTYAAVVSLLLAANFAVAEVLGLLPTAYADYHFLSGCTRRCLRWRRKPWSRISAAEVAQPVEIHIDGTNHAAGWSSVGRQAHGAGTSDNEPRKQPSSPLRVWVAWAAAASAVTGAGTVVWVMTAHAAGINLGHEEAMALPVQ